MKSLSMKLVFASNNKNKVREISHILDDKITLLSLGEVNILEDIPEDEPLIEGNALFKARYVFNATGLDVFADDTGLEVEALNGLPGVHSARFAGESKDSSANIAKVLAMLNGADNRNARFRTVIALIFEGKEYLFEGTISGTIIDEKRGDEGFGYDPVFIPEGQVLTFAQMSLNEKNKISHRALAFEKLKEFLNQYIITGNKQNF
jgi:XTP/dITP diphosphohydrolase